MSVNFRFNKDQLVFLNAKDRLQPRSRLLDNPKPISNFHMKTYASNFSDIIPLSEGKSSNTTLTQDISQQILSSRRRLSTLRKRGLQKKHAQLQIILHPGFQSGEESHDIVDDALNESNTFQKKQFLQFEDQILKKLSKKVITTQKDLIPLKQSQAEMQQREYQVCSQIFNKIKQFFGKRQLFKQMEQEEVHNHELKQLGSKLKKILKEQKEVTCLKYYHSNTSTTRDYQMSDQKTLCFSPIGTLAIKRKVNLDELYKSYSNKQDSQDNMNPFKYQPKIIQMNQTVKGELNMPSNIVQSTFKSYINQRKILRKPTFLH